MIMPYNERKSAIFEDFEDFYIHMGYPLEKSLYAIIGEAEYSPLYSQTDEICIYILFALMLISQGQDISFMRSKLDELANKKYMPQYERDLGSDFSQFLKDYQQYVQYISGDTVL